MIELLKKHKILICAGTGGVGKTTMSASLGVLAAGEGLRTLVLTIDPAHRLAQALGVEKRSGVEVEVKAVPNLSACMIDPRREFDEFVLGSVDKGIAKGLFNNRLYQQLVGNLNGSQEFTSLIKLLNVVESGKYDLVILDTPPTQNAVDFLKAPDRLYALFQDTVIGWFANPDRGESWIKRTIHRGTRIVTGALEKVTGSVFIAELKDFFNHIAFLKDRIAAASRDTRKLINSTGCGFILVTGFDEAKLKEALEFNQDLLQENLHLRAVIVNRWFPEWADTDTDFPKAWESDEDFATLKDFYKSFSTFFSQRQDAYETFEKQLGKRVPVLKLPDFKNNVQGIEELQLVADLLREKWKDR